MAKLIQVFEDGIEVLRREYDLGSPLPPPPPSLPRYRCTGTPNYQCVEDPNGPYGSLAECQSACKALPPPPPPAPLPINYPKLNKLAAGSGGWYGGDFGFVPGRVVSYCLPLGEVYPGKNIITLRLMTAATLDGWGDISLKLISPEGIIYTSDNPMADETITVMSQEYQKRYGFSANYPHQYLDPGYWTLEVDGKEKGGNVKLWWKASTF